jgi:hydroxyethylthiazole kinase-like uncharacterized protein yjeF
MIALYESVEQLDKRAVETFKMSEDLLMEHAALAMANEITKRFDRARVLIVCGAGNNGADGLALARLLSIKSGFEPKIFLPFGTNGELGEKQLKRALALGIEEVKAIEQTDILIDALIGGGLNRKPDESVIAIVEAINDLRAFKIACDIPSGVGKDGNFDVCVKADLTITMGAPKLGLFNDKIKDAIGELVVADLGIPREAYSAHTDAFLLEESDLKAPFRSRQDSHKGSYGRLSIVMGDKPGAALLSAMAALRFGAGLTTVISRERHIHLPLDLIQEQKPIDATKAIALGMGLGETYIDEELLEIVADRAVVIDADALSRPIARALLERKAPVILTPHPKEFAALCDLCSLGAFSVADVQENRLDLSLQFGKTFPNAILVLKGANTIIVSGDRRFINPHGSPALAKGGSGDVLTGMIGALLAQGYEPLEAAIHASLAHALAAKRFKGNSFSMTPSDLIEALKTL